MGHTSLEPEAPALLGPTPLPTLTADVKSWANPGKGLGVPADMEALGDPIESVLSDGLADSCTAGAAGGARPFPLPKMRPPPSLRPDIVAAVGGGGGDDERGGIGATCSLSRSFVLRMWAATVEP